MTVFIAFAEADRAVAETLEIFLERRGHFVELDNGEAALRPVQAADTVVLLNSKAFPFAQGRLRLEQRALDAWSEGRLVLVKLDGSFAPVGLRDLPFIDASFEPRREFVWSDVQDAIRGGVVAPAAKEGAAPPAARAASQAAPAQTPARKREAPKGGGGLTNVLLAFAMLPGAFALAVTGSIWLANRIGPRPGTWSDLLRGINQFGARVGAPWGVTPIVFAAAAVLTLVALVWLILRLARAHPKSAPRAEEAESAPAAPEPAPSNAVFVSYARANASLVLPVIDAAKLQGRKFWLDQEAMAPGDGWAGEIVRAIKGASGVLVMCSPAAFESDHVKREVYLADRYKKKLVPIFVEAASPPEDFEYFFAGVQWLNLFETPEPERSAAVLRILEAA